MKIRMNNCDTQRLYFFLALFISSSLFASTLPRKSIRPRYPSFPLLASSSSSAIPSLSTKPAQSNFDFSTVFNFGPLFAPTGASPLTIPSGFGSNIDVLFFGLRNGGFVFGAEEPFCSCRGWRYNRASAEDFGTSFSSVIVSPAKA